MLGIYHREGILDLCYSLDDRGLVSKECFKKELFKVALMFHPFLPDYCQGIVVHNDDDVWFTCCLMFTSCAESHICWGSYETLPVLPAFFISAPAFECHPDSSGL